MKGLLLSAMLWVWTLATSASAQEKKDLVSQDEVSWMFRKASDGISMATVAFHENPNFIDNKVVQACNDIAKKPLEAMGGVKKRCHQCHDEKKGTEANEENNARMDHWERLFWTNSALDHVAARFKTRSWKMIKVDIYRYLTTTQWIVCELVDGVDPEETLLFSDTTGVLGQPEINNYLHSIAR